MIPLPYKDENPTQRTPYVVMALIAVNFAVWVYELLHGVPESTFDYGAIPSWVLHATRDGELVIDGRVIGWLHQEVPWPLTVVTAMFMHGGWLHIIGNMWFLWIFGDNLEDRMGPGRFLVFYLLCGLGAAGAQILASPLSTVPMVGASGAIAGVMGGYLLLYPRAYVRCIWVLIIFITRIRVPAWLLLGLWFLSQFFVPEQSGVAWMAHVGGFVAGLALVRLFVTSRSDRPPPPPRLYV